MTNDFVASVAESEHVVSDFYARLAGEMESAGYSQSELAMLGHHRLYYGRYINPRFREYFVRTVIPAIASGLRFLFADPPRKPLRILDLGCGLGMQSLLFASLGARVTGVDIRQDSIDLCQRRLAYYRRQEDLAARFIQANFLEFEAESDPEFQPFDGVFSMSAFSYIQPLETTVAKISSLCVPSARVFLYEENSGHLARRLSGSDKSTPRPASVADCFEAHGFERQSLRGAAALPAPFWRYGAAPAASGVNRLLCRHLPLAFSYCLSLRRTG